LFYVDVSVFILLRLATARESPVESDLDLPVKTLFRDFFTFSFFVFRPSHCRVSTDPLHSQVTQLRIQILRFFSDFVDKAQPHSEKSVFTRACAHFGSGASTTSSRRREVACQRRKNCHRRHCW
jgi:hypothetical protein